MERRRLGLAAFLGPERGLDFWLELAAELGLGTVEVRAEPRLAHPTELDDAARTRLRRRLESLGLRPTVHASIHDTNLASLNPFLAAAALEDLREAVDLAADLGAEVVVFHPGRVPSEYRHDPGALERAREVLLANLEVAVPYAEKRGVKLALENKQRGSNRDLVLTPEEHVEVVDRFPGLWACLDFGHLHTLGLDPVEFARALAGKLLHVHLHDNHAQGDEHLPLARGTLDWKRCVAVLEEIGFRGTVILEIPDPEGLAESVELVADGEG
ncbi:sugar phosphate isomerase/epimerase family protein [Candidatus Bipolaricaulota sp. J31]